MKLRGARVLVTGAAGFIGANLLRRLIPESAELHILLRRETDTSRIRSLLGSVAVHYADLKDRSAVERALARVRAEIVFHLAANGVRADTQETRAMFDANVIGTVNLLTACKTTHLKLFIATGSVAEYGVRNVPLRESDPIAPVSDYGVSKAAATLYCRAQALRERLPVATLRLFTPYGYFEEPPRLIPSVILACLAGKPFTASSPKNRRDFIFIEDVVEAYCALVRYHRDAAGEIINIGSGREATVAEVIRRIGRATGATPRPRWGRFAGNHVEAGRWQADIGKARRILRWLPAHTLEQGITKTVAWFTTQR
ncbi:MAG: NAD-dependent epimerase/dehydratase family protein [Candidatus Omnitrophota bacterium]